MRAALLVLALLVASSAAGSEPLAPGHERYIVVLQGGAQHQAVADRATALGGTVEADLADRIIITGPPTVLL